MFRFIFTALMIVVGVIMIETFMVSFEVKYDPRTSQEGCSYIIVEIGPTDALTSLYSQKRSLVYSDCIHNGVQQTGFNTFVSDLNNKSER